MNPVAQLRSPAALLTALALLCGTLAIVLAVSAPAGAATRHGTFALTPASGAVSTGPTAVTASAACPAPATPDRPYTKGVLVLVNPGDPTATAPVAEVVPGGPLGTTPISGPLTGTSTGTGYATLQDRLRELVPAGPLDGRYELRLSCETADGEARAEYFSQMIEVTGDTWAAVGQQATNLKLTADSANPPVSRPFTITAEVQPATADGTVTFLTLVEDEVVELGTRQLANGRAEIGATMRDTVNAEFPVLAQYTPADPAAYTASSQLASFYAGPAVTPTPTGTPTPTPTGTPTGTPSGTPTPTGSPTVEPTDDPTDGPTDDPTDGPTDEPSGTATSTPGADTSTGTSGDGGTGTGSSGTTTDGTTTDGGTAGGTTANGGSGSLAATGSTAASAALGSLALCLLGAAAVIQARRRKAPRP
ncbi:hypothetical protein ACFV2S_16985 [Streptomyces sp. NPDC059695]|uniref:hypothetical protein n=1 Tax=Streptomyces sp. NPDC059695 TaxID=3346910 RepID=UPI003689186F